MNDVEQIAITIMAGTVIIAQIYFCLKALLEDNRPAAWAWAVSLMWVIIAAIK